MTFEQNLKAASEHLDRFLAEQNDHYGIGIGRHNPLWVAFCAAIENCQKSAVDDADMDAVDQLITRAMALREDRDARIHAARETMAEILEAINDHA